MIDKFNSQIKRRSDMNKQLISGLIDVLDNSSSENRIQNNQLNRLLIQETGAWAVGIWKIEGEYLQQILCAFEEGFPAQVAKDFQEGTVQVPLAQTKLGIVNAVVNRKPALALAASQQGDLAKSAGWLNRFGARCSLSCPIADAAGNIQAVIAVSWKQLYDQTDPVPQNLLSIAGQISEYA